MSSLCKLKLCFDTQYVACKNTHTHTHGVWCKSQDASGSQQFDTLWFWLWNNRNSWDRKHCSLITKQKRMRACLHDWMDEWMRSLWNVCDHTCFFFHFHLSLHVPKEGLEDKKEREKEVGHQGHLKFFCVNILIPKGSLAFHVGLGTSELASRLQTPALDQHLTKETSRIITLSTCKYQHNGTDL